MTAGSHVADAHNYATGVVAGIIPACKWVQAACKRQLDDLAKDDFEYSFDEVKAERVCDAIELMPHVKGKWAGDPIVLEPWQKFICCTTFGWVDAEGNRRFRTVYIEVPRKNAKSTLSAAIGLYMLAIDGEGGAEIYSAATTRDQAKIVFLMSKSMAKKSPEFCARFGVEVRASQILQEESASAFTALSAEGNSLDGLNIHFAAIDELHAHKTRTVFDVLETATGSRTQPLLWIITTAGSNRAGICYEQRTYLTKVLEKVTDDETYFGVIYTIDDEDIWHDKDVWRKANPNYGVSVFPDDIERLARKAQIMTSAQNNFLTKRLNVWVNADIAWMDMSAWAKCADPTLSLENHAGQACIAGLDLASKTDIAARIFLFPFEKDGATHYNVFGRYYLPEVAIEDGRNSQYSGWEIDNRVVTTPGDVLDFGKVEEDLIEDSATYEIQEIAYDPWQAAQMATRLQDNGATVIEYRNTVANFSAPMKEVDALVRLGRLHHDGDPVLEWMVSNVVCHIDNKENIYPKKERAENKIDGVVALIMALGRAMHGESEFSSPYEDPNFQTTAG